MRARIFAALATVLLLAGGASGEEAAANDNRFRLEKTESGYIRLDQRTGAVSFCREAAGDLTCRMAADERAAFEQELDLLAKRVDALERKMDAGPGIQKLPSDAEIEQSLSIMERFMRRFMGIVNEFRSSDADGTSL